MIKAIFACDKNWGIGVDNSLPWPKNSGDLKWFRDMTLGFPVVMGFNTWNSDMPKPLQGRINCVVSTKTRENFIIQPHCIIHPNNLENTLRSLEEKFIHAWIIGGSLLVNRCLELNLIDEFYINRFSDSYNCNVYLPENMIKNHYSCSRELYNNLSIEKWKKITLSKDKR